MKIFNPVRRKKAVTRNLHDFKGRFESVTQLKGCIMSELQGELPDDPMIDVGYFETCQSSKVWVVSRKDLKLMYDKAKNGVIYLWVQVGEGDENDSDNPEPKSKKRKSAKSCKCQKKEDELEQVYTKLKEKQKGSDYSTPQLKLWARMIVCGTHDDYEDPPRVPMFTGAHSKQQKQNSFTEALTGAAEAVARAFSPPPPVPLPTCTSSPSIPITSMSGNVGISPGKSTDLRMKNLQQLRVLQQLYDEKVIDNADLVEQKSKILDVLRNL